MKLTTTLTRLNRHVPCLSGMLAIEMAMGWDFDPDEEINLVTCLECNGFSDTLWAMRATGQDATMVAVETAIGLAGAVLHLFESEFPDDKRPRRAIEAASAAAYAASAAAADAALSAELIEITRSYLQCL